MSGAAFLAYVAGAAVALVGQIPAPTPASPLHVTTSFDLVASAPYGKTARLFGPEGERAWAGEEWDPELIYPRPAADVEGAVFTIQHGARKAIWVTSRRDMEARHFQYVYFLPEVMVTVIDVQFESQGDDATAVHVTYTRTSLTPEGDKLVKQFHANDEAAGPEWQKAIDAHLAAEKAGAKKKGKEW